jgi:hypothetical protein
MDGQKVLFLRNFIHFPIRNFAKRNKKYRKLRNKIFFEISSREMSPITLKIILSPFYPPSFFKTRDYVKPII